MSLDERLEGGEPVPIVRWGDPVLHRPGRPVTAFDEDLWDLLRTMFATNRAAQGAGLAAAQIGVDLDVFVYDCEDASGRRRRGVVCNPKLGQLPAAREGSSTRAACRCRARSPRSRGRTATRPPVTP